MVEKFTIQADKKAKAKAEEAKKKKKNSSGGGMFSAMKKVVAKASGKSSGGSGGGGSSATVASSDYVNNVAITPSLHEQCYLIEKAQEIYTIKKKEAASQIMPFGKDYVVRQLGLKPLTNPRYAKTNLQYVNYITRLDKTKNFFQITPEQKARIAHYAVISMGYRRPGSKTKIKSIFTNDHRKDLPSKLNIFQSKGKRLGAGIQSINVTYEGIDSATRKQVGVEVKFLFQDLRTMLSDPYVDLFRIGMTKNIKNKKYHRTVDFELGWRSTPDVTSKLNLNKLKLILRTYIVKYTFDIQQDGSIVVNASYRGHFARVFHGPNSNILSSAKSYFTTVSNAINEIEAKAVTKATKKMEQEHKLNMQTVALLMVKRQIAQNAPNGASKYEDRLVRFTKRNSSPDIDTDLKTIQQNAMNQASAIKNMGGADWAQDEGPMIAFYIKKHIQTLRERLKEDLKAKSTGGYGSRSDAEQREIQAKETLRQLGSEHDLANRQQQADNSGAAVANAEELARQQQLKEAKMAKFLALRQIAKKLSDEKDIHYAYLPRKAVEDFVTASAVRNGAQIKATMATLAAGTTLNAVTLTEETLSSEAYQVVPFVFLGKLVEDILALPASDPNSKEQKGKVYDLMLRGSGSKFTIDFGYFSYKSPYTGTPIDDFPLYYLPISLKKINDFFSREVIAKEKDFFAFDDFLMAILKKFLTGIFTLCADEANVEGTIPPKIQTVSGTRNKKMQYFIFGAKNALNDLKQGRIKFGNYNSNWKHHIYHFYLGGQIKGAVTSVKLVDIADENTRTAVYSRNMASGRDDLANYPVSPQAGTLPPVVFQANVTSLGFPLYNIGQFIYVDLLPYLQGNNKDKGSRYYKANGYYRVHKVNHAFTAENYSSTISTIIELSKYDWLNKDKKSQTAASSGKSTGPAKATVTSAETEKKLADIKKEREENRKRAEWAMKYAETGTTSHGEIPGAPTAQERAEESKTLKAEEAYLAFKETDTAKMASGGDYDCAFKQKYPKYYALLAKDSALELHIDGSNKPAASPC